MLRSGTMSSSAAVALDLSPTLFSKSGTTLSAKVSQEKPKNQEILCFLSVKVYSDS